MSEPEQQAPKEKILVIDDGTWQSKTLQKELEQNATTEAQVITVSEGASIKEILDAIPGGNNQGQGEGNIQKLYLYHSSDQINKPDVPETMIDDYNKVRDQYPNVAVAFVYQNANDAYVKNLGRVHGTYTEEVQKEKEETE